jgi:hypothetical protein
LANARKLSPLARLVHALRQGKYERILRSKKVVGRPKDLAHLPLLEQTIKLGKQSRAKT